MFSLDNVNTDALLGGLGIGTTYAAQESRISTILAGGQIAEQGQNLTAQLLGSQLPSLQGQLEFNQGVENLNMQRSLEATSRRYQRTLGIQATQQAATGFALGSKSFLVQTNETLTAFEDELINTKINSELRQRQIQFESELKQVEIQNQAKVAKYNAESQRYLAEVQASAARNAQQGKALSSAFSLASTFF